MQQLYTHNLIVLSLFLSLSAFEKGFLIIYTALSVSDMFVHYITYC